MKLGTALQIENCGLKLRMQTLFNRGLLATCSNRCKFTAESPVTHVMQTVGHCTGFKRAGGSPRICRRVGKRLRGVIRLSRERGTAPRGPGRRTQYRGRHGSVSVTMETPFAHAWVWCAGGAGYECRKKRKAYL